MKEKLEKKILWIHANLETSNPYVQTIKSSGKELEMDIKFEFSPLAKQSSKLLQKNNYDIILVDPNVAPGQSYKNIPLLKRAVPKVGFVDHEKMAEYLLKKLYGSSKNKTTPIFITNFDIDYKPEFEKSLNYLCETYFRMNKTSPAKFALDICYKLHGKIDKKLYSFGYMNLFMRNSK